MNVTELKKQQKKNSNTQIDFLMAHLNVSLLHCVKKSI